MFRLRSASGKAFSIGLCRLENLRRRGRRHAGNVHKCSGGYHHHRHGRNNPSPRWKPWRDSPPQFLHCGVDFSGTALQRLRYRLRGHNGLGGKGAVLRSRRIQNRALDFAQSFAIGSRAGVLGRRDAELRFRNFSLNTSSGSFGSGDVKGFIGFEDEKIGRYGWIQVEVSDTGTPGVPNELQVILNWAYDNTPGEAVAAGDTGASATAGTGLPCTGSARAGSPGHPFLAPPPRRSCRSKNQRRRGLPPP